MSNHTAVVNYMKVILGTDVSEDIVRYVFISIFDMVLLITFFSYISSIKHEDDYEEFMENILDRNNSAHIRSYEGIRDIIFKKKKGKKDFKNESSTVKQNQAQHSSNKVQKSNQNTPSVSHMKKGKAKFKDINTYQEKKKQKEGLLM